MYRRSIALFILVALLLLTASIALATPPTHDHVFLEGSDHFSCDTDGDFSTVEYTLTSNYFINFQFMIYFDRDGLPRKFTQNVNWEGHIRNDDTGEALVDRQVWFDRLNPETNIVTGTHTLHVRIPGFGSVMHDVGYYVFDENLGQLTFTAGKHPLVGAPELYDFCTILGGGVTVNIEELWVTITPVGNTP